MWFDDLSVTAAVWRSTNPQILFLKIPLIPPEHHQFLLCQPELDPAQTCWPAAIKLNHYKFQASILDKVDKVNMQELIF